MKFKKYFILYFFTLKNIGVLNFIKRIKYELKIYFLKQNFSFFIKNYRKEYKKLKWIDPVLLINPNNIINEKDFSSGTKYVELTFLNKIEKLNKPLDWNIDSVTRLWRFNLNYFYCLRKFLENYLKNDFSIENFKENIYLIYSWIDFHLNNYGDGWHSYTISLRIRNWIWFLRFFPNLSSNKIKENIWVQINWLYENREYHLGGNHLLENLITLIFGSLQFKGQKAELIFSECLDELADQLNKQILDDGGHEERSCSYHLMILQNLCELALVLQSLKKIRPIWLVKTIKIMTEWSCKVKLNANNYPRFNDSIYSEEINIETIIDLSFSYLEQIIYVKESDYFHFRLCEFVLKDKNLKLDSFSKYKSNYPKTRILDLQDTGWSILRPNNSWEIIFKSGISGPNHLLGHGHSDLHTFDIFYDGKLLIGETGTSQYAQSNIRDYERSAISHNIIQFAKKKEINLEKIKDWHQPLEVWDSFRVARKPKIINRSYGVTSKGILWVKGVYYPFQKYIERIERIMKFKILKDNKLEVDIQDNVLAKYDIYWKFNLHFSPGFKKGKIKLKLHKNNKTIKMNQIESWTSFEFGKRIASESLIIFGYFNKGHDSNNLKFVLDPNKSLL